MTKILHSTALMFVLSFFSIGIIHLFSDRAESQEIRVLHEIKGEPKGIFTLNVLDVAYGDFGQGPPPPGSAWVRVIKQPPGLPEIGARIELQGLRLKITDGSPDYYYFDSRDQMEKVIEKINRCALHATLVPTQVYLNRESHKVAKVVIDTCEVQK